MAADTAYNSVGHLGLARCLSFDGFDRSYDGIPKLR
jgi:hypothetical protein